MNNGGSSRFVLSTCRLPHTYQLVLMLFVSLFIFLYVITERDSDVKKTIAATVSRTEIQIMSTKEALTNLNETSVTSHEISNNGTNSNFKSEKWYSTKIEALHPRKVRQPPRFLNQPYFHPDPKTRHRLSDGEILRPSVCSNKTQIIVQILSEPSSISMKKRTAIRQTWGSVAYGKQWPWVDFTMDIKLVFVIGRRSSVSTNATKSLTEARDYSNLKAESEAYSDILQLNTTDSYTNLTRKMIQGFKWINKNCPKIRYVIKADQDIFVNVPLIWQFLKEHGQLNSIYGRIYPTSPVHRSGRWAVSRSKYPFDKYPPYTSGTCYVISSDVITKILQTYYLFPYIPIEDAFIAGIVASAAKIDRYHVNGFTHWEERKLITCDVVMDKKVAGNGVTLKSIREIWSEIEKQEHSICI